MIQDEEVMAEIDRLALLFAVLIFVEVMLFSFVNIADLIINSSQTNGSNSSSIV